MKTGDLFRIDAPMKAGSLFDCAVGVVGYHLDHLLLIVGHIRLPFLEYKKEGGLVTPSARVA